MSREQRRLPAELNHPLGAEESRQKLEELTARTVTATVEKDRREASGEVYYTRKNLNGKSQAPAGQNSPSAWNLGKLLSVAE